MFVLRKMLLEDYLVVERENKLVLTNSFPRCSQWLGLGQVQVGSWEFRPALPPPGWQNPQDQEHRSRGITLTLGTQMCNRRPNAHLILVFFHLIYTLHIIRKLEVI